MKRRYKTYIKINFISLILVVLSFISITMAWFAYSGLSKVATEINVKAWNIEMKKGANFAKRLYNANIDFDVEI